MKRRREFLPKCIVYRRSEIRRIMLLVISFCFFASLMLQRHISNQLAKQLTSPTEDFLCSKNKFLVVHSSISDGEDSSGQNKRSILNKSPRWPKKKIDLLNISAAQIIQEFLNDPKSNSKILQPIDDEPSSSNNLPQWMEGKSFERFRAFSGFCQWK